MTTNSAILTAVASHRQAGNLNEAERLCRAILAGDALHAGAHYQLGCVLKDQRRFAEALTSFHQAASIEPGLAEAYFEAATIYHGAARARVDPLARRRDSDAAEAAYRAAIAARPDYVEAYNNLGAVYRSAGKLAEAIQCYQRVLALRPDFVETRSNLGIAYRMQGRLAEALACYDDTLRLSPDYAQAHLNRALAWLSMGRFAEGWAEYEWRWKCADFQPPPHTLPIWDGGPLVDRTLLIHAEQGFGDTLQFVRYVPLVAARGGRVVCEVQLPLASLLKQSGIPGVVAQGEALPPCDVRIPLLSLPRIFGTTCETIPRDVPYLTADPGRVDQWRQALGDEDAFRVAIAWQGRPSYRDDRCRSFHLTEFEPLSTLPGVRLVSVQKDQGAQQIAQVAGRWPLVDVSPRLHDFHDTAAAIRNVDLVITCDSAVAHLAGALGVPTWVALPFAADWRWLSDRDDSPWYPSVRLFRQATMDDWSEVFHRMAQELAALVASSREQPKSSARRPA
ncbi:MAG: tetratricopeptide repeat-containing glycosyltransferase family protein [Pirellulales bacterium]